MQDLLSQRISPRKWLNMVESLPVACKVPCCMLLAASSKLHRPLVSQHTFTERREMAGLLYQYLINRCAIIQNFKTRTASHTVALGVLYMNAMCVPLTFTHVLFVVKMNFLSWELGYGLSQARWWESRPTTDGPADGGILCHRWAPQA